MDPRLVTASTREISGLLNCRNRETVLTINPSASHVVGLNVTLCY